MSNKNLTIKDLTQAGEMSFLRIGIPGDDPKTGERGYVYIRWENGSLNIEVTDLEEPFKGGMELVEYSKENVILRLGGE